MMIKALLIAFPCIGIYIGITLGAYAIYNYIDLYDENADIDGDGDVNKVVAFLWPVSAPLLLVGAAIDGLVKIMDLIRKYQKGCDKND